MRWGVFGFCAYVRLLYHDCMVITSCQQRYYEEFHRIVVKVAELNILAYAMIWILCKPICVLCYRL